MKHVLLATVVATLLLGTSTQAPGQGMLSHCGTRHGCSVWRLGPTGPVGKIIDVPPPFDPDGAIAARDKKWEDFCQPKIVLDSLGVGRYQYAKAGCEFGRSQ